MKYNLKKLFAIIEVYERAGMSVEALKVYAKGQKRELREKIQWHKDRELAHRKAHSFAQMWRHKGKWESLKDILEVLGE